MNYRFSCKLARSVKTNLFIVQSKKILEKFYAVAWILNLYRLYRRLVTSGIKFNRKIIQLNSIDNSIEKFVIIRNLNYKFQKNLLIGYKLQMKLTRH